MFPLFVGDDFTGLLFMLAEREISPDEVRYLEVFALQTASIIRWSKVYGEIERLRDQLAHENSYLDEAVRQEAGFSGIVGNQRGAQGSAAADRPGRAHRFDGAARPARPAPARSCSPARFTTRAGARVIP